MFILRPLRSLPIALLWGGQVLSAIGDEVYKVALVWMAIELTGKDAGFLISIEAGSILVFGLLGGLWAERWDARRTMVAVDIIRGVTVLAIPFFAIFHPPTLPLLILVAIVVSSLMAIFDPALQSTLPEIAADEEALQSASALMEATRRLSRIVGPGLVAGMGALVPIVHFFTIDSLTFFASALSILLLNRVTPARARIEEPLSSDVWAGLKRSWKLIRDDRLLAMMVCGCFLTWSLWSLCFSLGLALLVNERTPGNMGAYGLLIAAYGVGNLGSNLVMGSIPIRRPDRVTFIGTAIIGFGFLMVAWAPTVSLQLLACAFCGMGGPLEDLSFLRVLQRHYKGADIARIFRLRMVLAFGGIAAIFLLSPIFFRLLSVVDVIAVCAVLMLVFAAWGLWMFRTGSKHDSGGEHQRRKDSNLRPELSNGVG